MSHPVPQQRPLADAARGDVPSAPSADRSLPEFPQHAAPAAPSARSPIEREIERSERASAALAATRALARASFTDSQLAAEGENADVDGDGDGDGEPANWVRTEYASLDQSVRAPQSDVPHGGVPRNLVGGGFNPGLAFQDVRAFPGSSITRTPIKTRSGAHARFLPESRQTPRPERNPGAPRTEHSLSSGAGLYDKPAVIPMLATPRAAPSRPANANIPKVGRARVSPGEPPKFALAVAIGTAIVLIGGGGVAWKSGWLRHDGPGNAGLASVPIAASKDAERALSAAPQQSALTAPAADVDPTPPAAGLPSARTRQEVDAALAAAARAAAVPMASVHAAGPARVARPLPLPRALAPARGTDGVSSAVASAQARADSFLASGNGPTTAAAAAPEVKKDE